jgi:hypothetical protein
VVRRQEGQDGERPGGRGSRSNPRARRHPVE